MGTFWYLNLEFCLSKVFVVLSYFPFTKCLLCSCIIHGSFVDHSLVV